MKRPVPEWLQQLVWFFAGIYATGAIWYYLSKDDFIVAGLSVAGAVAMTVVAIQLQRLNDRSARFRSIREQLAKQIEGLSALLRAHFQ